MNMIKKKIFVWFYLILSFVLFRSPIALNAKEDILHLKKNDFDAYFKKNSRWNRYYEEMQFRMWNSPFVCWNRKTRRIIIPNLNLTQNKEILPVDLAAELEYFYKEIGPTRYTYLISQDEMISISIKYLIKNKYSYIERVKYQCSYPENRINFYIFDFSKHNKMDIYLGVEDTQEGFQLILNPFSIANIAYNEEWQLLLKSNIPGIKFKVALKGSPEDKTILDAYPSIDRVKFYDPRKSIIFNKDIVKIEITPIPVIHLRFDLSKEVDLEMLKTSGMWIEEKGKIYRITNSSIYSHMLEYYNKKGIIKDNTFELFYTHATNFSETYPEPSDTIKDKKLTRVSSSMPDIKKGVAKITVYKGKELINAGTGIVVGRKSGKVFIQTAYHVIEDSRIIKVKFNQMLYQTFKGKLFEKYNSNLDIAIVMVDPDIKEIYESFPILEEGNLSQLKESNRVRSICNPLGEDWSMVSNEVQKLYYENDLQKLYITKTGINNGCSGGPIFNEKLKIIGMITKIDRNGAIGTKIDAIIKLLKVWGIPTNLITTVKSMKNNE